MNKILPLILFIIISLSTQAQFSVKDSSFNIPLFSIHYIGHKPGGDLADRFGMSSMVGANFTLKTKKNWLFGADLSFMYGQDVKNEENYFHGIRNANGYIIDGNGMFAEIYLYERGYAWNGQIGRQFNFLSPNPNSGPFIQVGVGFLRHKVRIENPYKAAVQVIDDYLPYYDRLTNGVNFTEMIGYRFLSDKRLLNFYAAIEFNQAFTKCRRSYNIDDLGPDNRKRVDILNGIRIGWILPLYPKAPKEFYYY